MPSNRRLVETPTYLDRLHGLIDEWGVHDECAHCTRKEQDQRCDQEMASARWQHKGVCAFGRKGRESEQERCQRSSRRNHGESALLKRCLSQLLRIKLSSDQRRVGFSAASLGAHAQVAFRESFLLSFSAPTLFLAPLGLTEPLHLFLSALLGDPLGLFLPTNLATRAHALFFGFVFASHSSGAKPIPIPSFGVISTSRILGKNAHFGSKIPAGRAWGSIAPCAGYRRSGRYSNPRRGAAQRVSPIPPRRMGNSCADRICPLLWQCDLGAAST